MKVSSMKLSSFVSIFAVLFFYASCKKNDTVSNPPDSSLEQKQKDSALAISRDIYLWNDQIPSTFDARAYDDLNELMIGVREFSIEPGFNEPVDLYSFAVKQNEWNDISKGIISDFGLNAFFYTDTDLRVRSVEEESPAGKAGIRRGWKFVTVAGSSDINSDNIDFLVESIYESPTTQFTFEKPDGSLVSVTLNAATYKENPVYLDSIYTAGARKAGYIVFNSFLGDTAKVNSEFERIFNNFVAEGVTDVVIDLRYNGGGYVSLQNKLANYLIKPTANNGIMMTQQFNSNYADLNEVTMFKKQGSLNVSNIYFIVTDNTASASELLINNLKPYMNVKLVGPEPTYGKPVGFFPLPVGDWYIFPVSFRSTNSRNEGSYFDGLAVDQVVNDGLDKDWGDRNESALASVLSHIGTGAFASAPPLPGLNSTLESNRKKGNIKLRRGFNGAIDFRD